VKHWRPALLWTAVLAGGLGLWAGFSLGPRPSPPASPPAQPAIAVATPGQPLPPLRLTGLDGYQIELQQLQGRPLLINVWASWCAPCVEEMPELQRYADSQGQQGVQVLGLALDTPEQVAAFLQRVPVRYPIAIDTPGPADASVRLGNRQGLLPYTVLIDADGVVGAQKLGPFAAGEIDAWVTSALP